MRFSTPIITLPSFRKYDLLLLFLKNRVHTGICRVMYFFPVSVRSSLDVLDKDQSLYLPSPAQTKGRILIQVLQFFLTDLHLPPNHQDRLCHSFLRQTIRHLRQTVLLHILLLSRQSLQGDLL